MIHRGQELSTSGTALVSVIIPFLDTPETFLREAVASVLSQDYSNFELLLVNDGSGATATSVALGLTQGNDRKVRYLAQPGGENRGVSAARNLGVSEADGEYIAFLDSDDIWKPGKLTEQVEILNRFQSVDMVFGVSEYWYDWQQSGHVLPKNFVPNTGAKVTRVLHPPGFVTDFLRGRVVVPTPSNLMVRREAYLACGGFEESFRGMYEDQAFYAKLGLVSGVCVVPQCWDRYRQHSGSLTARADETSSETLHRREFLEWLKEYCRHRRIDSPEMWETISKALWLCPRSGDEASTGWARRIRWGKKWLLNFEEALVPAKIRRRWWLGRDKPPSKVEPY